MSFRPLLASLLILGSCTTTMDPASSPQVERANAVAAVFREACLPSEQTMNGAFAVFDTYGYRYKHPIVPREYASKHSSRHGLVQLSKKLTRAELDELRARPDSHLSDFPIDGCAVTHIGLFLPEAWPEVSAGLVDMGFTPRKALAAPTTENLSRTMGVYRRGGEDYVVTISQRSARQPNQPQDGAIRYLRGNSITSVAILKVEN